VWYFSEEEFATNYFHGHMLLALYIENVDGIRILFFYIMYFGLQDTKPPPCPLHLTKQGGSIHCSQLYLYAVYKLVLYILETITSVFYLSYSIMCPTPYDIVLHYHTVFYFFWFF
jgi:hypothetical protein